jgi:hypothetical protein
MANTTLINVSATDNELYIIASTAAGSSELCHIKSGYNDRVSYSFNPGHILPAGTYNLTVIGINWGGPGACIVTLTGGPALPPFPSGPAPVGVFYSHTVSITVAP